MMRILLLALAVAGPAFVRHRHSFAAAAEDGSCEAGDNADGSCGLDLDPSLRRVTTAPKKRRRNFQCQDKEEACKGWAKLGECKKNPDYMLSECFFVGTTHTTLLVS